MTADLDISRLSPAECILLAEQLWERARNHPDAVPVTEAQMTELNRRLDAHERGDLPPGSLWEEVDDWLGTL
jgi:putative addiction module component (TIGR02574 family)